MESTILKSGSFVSDGLNEILYMPEGADWIIVRNETAGYTSGGAIDLPFQFRWQRGQTRGRGDRWILQDNVANDPVTFGQIPANGGFVLIDTQTDTGGTPIAVTDVSNDAIPVVTAAAHGLVTGDIVRLTNITSGKHLSNMKYSVTVLTANTFQLIYMPQIAAIAAPGATARVKRVTYAEAYEGGRWAPRSLYMSAVTTGATTTIEFTTLYTDSFAVGSRVRFQVPDIYDMTELDGLEGTVLSVSLANNTITVDIDSTGFTAFVYPTNADVVAVGGAFTPAMAAPLSNEAFATENQNFVAFELAGGDTTPGAIAGPAGAANDVMYWVSGRGYPASTL